jgi:PIN domain nuclease of toxin-antitoxin system
MRLLLDTHIALWAAVDSPSLPARARRIICDVDAQIYVSVVSLWEIAIKYARRRGRSNDMPVSAAEMARILSGAQCEILPMTTSHVLALEGLPPLHGDPFDRMLVAQAGVEPLRLVTADSRLGAYGQMVELV